MFFVPREKREKKIETVKKYRKCAFEKKGIRENFEKTSKNAREKNILSVKFSCHPWNQIFTLEKISTLAP